MKKPTLAHPDQTQGPSRIVGKHPHNHRRGSRMKKASPNTSYNHRQ
jgi:hypothetical protein